MTQEEELEGPWERLGEKAETKWGKLTRAERAAASGRRHSLQVKLHELYGVSEEEAERALAAVEIDEPGSNPAVAKR